MKKTLSIVGLVVGFAFVVVGILSVSGILGGGTGVPSTAPSYYDAGYASFGGDYYTYSSNNAAEAASAARTAAYNVHYFAQFIETFFGLTSILFGLMVMCGFGILLCSCIKEKVPAVINEISHEAETTVEPDVVAAE